MWNKITFLTDREKIEKICKKYKIRDYKINSDGLVDVDGEVNLSNWKLERLPFRFGKVNGNFSCMSNKLTTLEGAPNEVIGGFYGGDNRLTSLEGAPSKIKYYFSCADNYLTSLEGCPKKVQTMDCRGNPLKSLNEISMAEDYRFDRTNFEWASGELKDLLLFGLDFGLSADECLCLSKKNPNREGMINNLGIEKKRLIEVFSILYELKK